MSDIIEDQKIHYIVKDYRRMFNKYQALKAVIEEMLDTDIPFVQAEDDKKCKYCDYKLICKR